MISKERAHSFCQFSWDWPIAFHHSLNPNRSRRYEPNERKRDREKNNNKTPTEKAELNECMLLASFNSNINEISNM